MEQLRAIQQHLTGVVAAFPGQQSRHAHGGDALAGAGFTNEAQGMLNAPWYVIGTGLMIVLMVFGVGLIGEGLQRRDKGVA